ncbi:hypothetical protein AKG34_08925 [Peribacillus butanolivorans]|uniref:ABC-three component system protein n=2 Tax=Peribacillus TaxID=2675229 RepID=UPI0006A74A2B|nr:ABC-three component system protein [Peribacillus butanolivorans]KON68897.1 hypothetical protein AKG34_08925 [Peribacillus butanolivorans]
MNISSQHTAPGQMAGYLFQPERALFWLINSQRGAVVGIETNDDVVKFAKNNKEHSIYEQDKHSISSNIPFGDHSKDLWNTLHIWLKEIKKQEVDINYAQFHLVTNKVLSDCLAKRIGTSNTEHEVLACIKEIRTKKDSVPKGVLKIVTSVLEYDDEELGALIKRVVLTDGLATSHGEELKEKMSDILHLPTDIPFNEIYYSLLGWIHTTVITLWREGKPAWISRRAFDKQYWNVISRFQDKTFKETSKSLLPISDIERKAQLHKMFVRQLYLLSLNEDNELLINSIDDFLRCNTERTRLSMEGDITKEDFEIFEESLVERWKLIYERYNFKYSRSRNEDEKKYRGEEYGGDIL